MKKTRIIRASLELCSGPDSYWVWNDKDGKLGEKDAVGRDFEKAAFKEKDFGMLSKKMKELECQMMDFDEKIRELRAKQVELWEDFVFHKSVYDCDARHKEKIPVHKRLKHARVLFKK